MPRLRLSPGRVLALLALSAAVARAATSWGPANLVVLVGFALSAALGLAGSSIVPHRAFWAGLGGFGWLYVVILWFGPSQSVFGIGPGADGLYRRLAESHYGTAPDFKISTAEDWIERVRAERSRAEFVTAAHALEALLVGVLGGLALHRSANVRESRRWDRAAPPERPLEDFLPPLKIDPPLNP